MRCKACQGVVPPEWVHCINKNECPGCGSELMNEGDKQLLSELSEAMAKMPNNSQGLAGWLLSNYNLTKIGEGKPVEKFHDKSSTKENEVRRAISEDKFLGKTDAYRNIQKTREKARLAGAKNNKLAEFANQIAGTDPDDMYGSGSSDIGDPGGQQMDEEYTGEEMPEQYDEEEQYSQPQGGSMKKALGAGNMFIDPKVKPLTAEEINAVIGISKSALSKNGQEPALLHKKRMDKLESQRAFESGGGGFRRSE